MYYFGLSFMKNGDKNRNITQMDRKDANPYIPESNFDIIKILKIVGSTINNIYKTKFENTVITYCLLQLLQVIVLDVPHTPLKTLHQLILFWHAIHCFMSFTPIHHIL